MEGNRAQHVGYVLDHDFLPESNFTIIWVHYKAASIQPPVDPVGEIQNVQSFVFWNKHGKAPIHLQEFRFFQKVKTEIDSDVFERHLGGKPFAIAG